MTRPTIRRAEPTDLPTVQALVNASWRKTYRTSIPAGRMEDILARRHALALLQSQLVAPDSLFLLAEQDGETVGHAYAEPKPDALYLDRLHVRPDLKGGGIGRALMETVFDHVGEKPVTLELLADNHAARGFYERLGFTVTEQTPSCGGEIGIDALVMERPPG